MLVLAVALAGAIGAPARFLVDGLVQGRSSGERPFGTFVVNVTGSFVLGFLTGLALYHALPSTPRVILGAGFCGAYTTFSSFTYETVQLVEQGELRGAASNLFASLLFPAAAAALGLALATL